MEGLSPALLREVPISSSNIHTMSGVSWMEILEGLQLGENLTESSLATLNFLSLSHFQLK